MTGPRRYQRKRTVGWKMPGNAIYVGRPSEYGNPFRLPQALASRRLTSEVRLAFVDLYAKWLQGEPRLVAKVKAELKGKNLVCWCSLSEACHADVLLSVANTGDKPC